MPDGRFWTLVFPLQPGAEDCELVKANGALYDVQKPEAVVIEVFGRDDDGATCWSILVSVADSLETPSALRCVFAVSNRAEECDQRAKDGFPIVEGDIKLSAGAMTVDTALYPPRAPGQPSGLTISRLMTLSNVLLRAPMRHVAFDPPYWTLQCAPDLACPDSQLTGRILANSPGRHHVQRVDLIGRVVVGNALYPDLQALLGKTSDSVRAWSGRFDHWHQVGIPKKRFRFNRRSVFGPPTFRFDEIEIVGFRAPLKDSSPLVERLNFHEARRHRNSPKHFRYRAASPMVAIEMLRYGRMRGEDVPPPFDDEDFMPQHELLVRLVVGRVDDDTSQARDGALFVPAIFVDNPWSKAVGRQLQGFPKLLAEFRAGNDVLGMDGRPRHPPDTKAAPAAPADKVPLHKITEVHLADGVDADARRTRLLTIECPDEADGSADEFIAPSLTSFLSSSSTRRSRWEQFDFIDAEFRRTFAQSVIGDQFGGFRVVQVSPVPDIGLPKAWILGRYTLSNVRVAFPSGVATLRLNVPHPPPPGWPPPGWDLLLKNLRDRPDQLAFATGEWYRVKCSMELQFDDGLEW
jgi:hypothetical protein